MSAAEVREFGEADLTAVHALNEQWVPHVGSIDPDALAALVEQSALSLVAHGADGDLAGFVVVLSEGAEYSSPNYRWFAARHERFTYLDRIAVAEGARGSGLGRLLYGLVTDHGRGRGSAAFCAEVNLEPPNPDSLAFHRRMGFSEVGTQWTYDGTVQVQLLELPL